MAKKKKLSKQEFDAQGLGEIYNLRKDEALEILKQHDASRAGGTQMLNRHLNNGHVKGVLVEIGKIDERGWWISEKSLRDFIAYKTLTLGDFLHMQAKIERFEAEKAQSDSLPLPEEKKAEIEESEPSDQELRSLIEEVNDPGEDLSEESIKVLTEDVAKKLLKYTFKRNKDEFKGKEERLTALFMQLVFKDAKEIKWYRNKDEKYKQLAAGKTGQYKYDSPEQAIYEALSRLKKGLG